MRYLLTGGTICTFDGEGTTWSPGALGIDANRIAFVGPAAPRDFVPDEIIDCSGKYILPGFVNAHVHLGEHLLRGWMDEVNFEGLFYSHLFSWESALTPDLIYTASLAAMAEALRCGVTTVADMYHHAAATARAVQGIGIRARLGQKILGFSLDRPPQAIPSGVDYRFDQRAFATQLDQAVGFAEQWAGEGDGRITTALAPHATNTLTAEMLRDVAKEARAGSFLVHMHLAQMRSEVETVRERDSLGCVELLAECGLLDVPFLGAHAIFLAPNEVQLLVDHGAAVAHNPIANAKDAGLIAPAIKFQEAGVTIGLGTDAFRMDILEAARFAACLHRVHAEDGAVCPAYDVLSWATRSGALAVGLGEQIGSLETGKLADVIAIDGTTIETLSTEDPYTTILYYAGPEQVRWVFVNGQPVVRDGTLVTMDLVEIRDAFEEGFRAFRKQIGR